MADLRRRGGERARVQGSEPDRRQRRHRVHPRSLHRPAVRRPVRGSAHAGRRRIPIPDFAEIPAGMLAAHTFGGKLTAVPFRHATHGLHYNTEFFAEKGVGEPPRNGRAGGRARREAHVQARRRRAGLRPGDELRRPVRRRSTGSAASAAISSRPTTRWCRPARPRCAASPRSCDLYKKGVLPKNSMSLKTEDVTTFMQQGRGGDDQQSVQPLRQLQRSEGEQVSRARSPSSPLPLAVDGKPMPAKTSVWAMAIPRNGQEQGACVEPRSSICRCPRTRSRRR